MPKQFKFSLLNLSILYICAFNIVFVIVSVPTPSHWGIAILKKEDRSIKIIIILVPFFLRYIYLSIMFIDVEIYNKIIEEV